MIKTIFIKSQLDYLHLNISVLLSSYKTQLDNIWQKRKALQNVSYFQDRSLSQQALRYRAVFITSINAELKKISISEQTQELIEMVKNENKKNVEMFNHYSEFGIPQASLRLMFNEVTHFKLYLDGLISALNKNEMWFAWMQYANLHSLEQYTPVKEKCDN